MGADNGVLNAKNQVRRHLALARAVAETSTSMLQNVDPSAPAPHPHPDSQSPPLTPLTPAHPAPVETIQTHPTRDPMVHHATPRDRMLPRDTQQRAKRSQRTPAPCSRSVARPASRWVRASRQRPPRNAAMPMDVAAIPITWGCPTRAASASRRCATASTAATLRLPAAALRFHPPTAIAPAGGAKGKSKSGKRGASGAPGQQVVYVLDQGKLKRAPVKLGLTDGNYIEILSGLDEGQTVVTGTVTTGKAAAPATTQPGPGSRRLGF